MMSATVTIFMPCLRAKRRRSGIRAIDPSDFITSQTTAVGLRPARRQRSTDASVWPARTSTPPSRARSGKMWPGRVRSIGLLFGSARTAIVRARSPAEMPVVTPSRASTLTVNAVPRGAVLRAAIIGRSKRSRSSPVIGTQISPRAWVAMRLTMSASQNSAAIAMSPSFSRSSSSTMISGRPWRNSSIASSTPITTGDAVARRLLLPEEGSLETFDMPVAAVIGVLFPGRRR